MLQYSQYPEAADDSIVADDNTVPAGNVTYVAAPLPSAAPVVEEEEEEYDEEEIRELNRRSGGGKGIYIIMAILAIVAIAALAVGSTLFVQKKRSEVESIETSKQSVSSPPPSPPVRVAVTLAPTVNGTNLSGNITGEGEGSLGSNLTGVDYIFAGTTSSSNDTTTGIDDTENGITEFAEFDVVDGGGSVDVVDGATEDNNVGGVDSSSSTGSSGGDGINGEVNDSNVIDGSEVLLGENDSGGIDSSTTSSPGEDIIDESSGESNQESSGSTIVDANGDGSGLTDEIGGNVGLPLPPDETDPPTATATTILTTVWSSPAPTSSSQTTPTTIDGTAESTAVSSECVVGGKCVEEGSTCSIGEETCCGETYDSIVCDCIGGEWLCRVTDACNRPDCGDLNTTAPTAALPYKTTDTPSVNIARLPSASPVPSNEPTCSNSIEVSFVTEEQGNLDNTGYTLMSAEGSDSTTYMETFPGDLKNTTAQYDVACVPSGAYVFTVDDDTSKCCGVNKGYYAVKVNGEEVVRERSYFISPHAFIIRTDYQSPTAQAKSQWLDKHNDVRERFHTENGVSFRPMVWSDSLATAAAERANDIATTCEIGPSAEPWGENIGRTNFGVYNEAYVSPDFVFAGWNNFEDHPLTHWQINWRPTRYVGCATNITQMQTDGRYCHVAVCKYTRPHCNVDSMNWLNQTLQDYSMCGPSCPSEGCY